MTITHTFIRRITPGIEQHSSPVKGIPSLEKMFTMAQAGWTWWELQCLDEATGSVRVYRGDNALPFERGERN